MEAEDMDMEVVEVMVVVHLVVDHLVVDIMVKKQNKYNSEWIIYWSVQNIQQSCRLNSKQEDHNSLETIYIFIYLKHLSQVYS